MRRSNAIPAAALVSALAAVISPAAAQDASPQAVPAPAAPASDLDPIRQGLVARMRASAQHLSGGARFEATKALNEARHLGEAAATAANLGAQAAIAFKMAHEAVTNARHALQNGKPQDAARILTEGAARLEQARWSEAAAPPIDPAAARNATGRVALNTRGETLGDVAEIEAPPRAPFRVRVRLGGLFGIGGKIVTVPVGQALIGSTYVALASDVKREDLERR